jgi:hypothetical protein
MALFYISGLTSGAQKQFDKAEDEIIALGHSPVNPLKIHKDGTLNIAIRLEALSRCEGIYLLPGWMESIEARAEKFYAEIIGKQILFQSRTEADKYKGAVIESHVNRIAGAIHEATGMKLQDYATGPRKVLNYYCRLLFAVHCQKAGIDIKQVIGTYMDRSQAAVKRSLKKYDDELFNPQFRALAERVNTLLYPET